MLLITLDFLVLSRLNCLIGQLESGVEAVFTARDATGGQMLVPV